MTDIFQEFQFQTKAIPQAPGLDGSHWESLPLAAMPPKFDIQFPNGTTNAIAVGASSLMDTFSGLKDTLENTTQVAQNAACSLGDMFDNLLDLFNEMENFAQDNNRTRVFTKMLGVTPVGSINSTNSFMNQVKEALYDTGSGVGLIPKITPSSVPNNPILIANVLGASGSLVEGLELGGALGSALGGLGAEASIGLNLEPLTNGSEFRDGFIRDGENVAASTLIRDALKAEGLVSTINTIPVTDIVAALAKHGIIHAPDISGDSISDLSLSEAQEESIEKDKAAAAARLTTILSKSQQRIGGFVLVGKAPNISALARKIHSLSQIMDWLEPLAKQLAFTALSEKTTNPGGIDFDPTQIDLTKLNPDSNVAKKDIEAVTNKIAKGGILDKTPTKLSGCAENPSPTDFTKWRCYSPVQLIPGMSLLGESGEGLEDQAKSKVETVAGEIGASASKLLEKGKAGVQDVLNHVNGLGSVIDNISAEMNAVNQKVVDATQFMKDSVTGGMVSLDGHLIGPKLNLESNEAFVDAVQAAINDISDLNRPTFGPPASPSLLGSLSSEDQKAALTTGVKLDTDTTIWFGMLLVITGENSKALGDQMSTIGELLSMDMDSLALAKKKVSWTL